VLACIPVLNVSRSYRYCGTFKVFKLYPKALVHDTVLTLDFDLLNYLYFLFLIVQII
jgi:hypothetical protein